MKDVGDEKIVDMFRHESDAIYRLPLTKREWYDRFGAKREGAEAARKSALPKECRCAPDDDPGWTRWELVVDERDGSHRFSRRNLYGETTFLSHRVLEECSG
jgi:hypothetical protein